MLREDILLGCAITEKETHQRNSPLTLAKLTVFPDVKLQKCLMGHRDERRLLASPMFQHWIEFCKTHSEIRLQAVEVELLTQAEMEERRCALMNQNTISNNSNSSKSSSGNSSSGIVVNSSASTSSSSAQPPQIPLPPVPTTAGTTSGVTPQSNKRSKVESLLLRPLKLLGRDKNYVAHEVEDSIIFLTKSDLEKIEAQKRGLLRHSTSQLSISGGTTQLDQPPQQHPQSNTISDKMKVFEQENKRTGSSGGGGWFSDRKNNKSNSSKTKSFTSYDILHKKLTANDRYCDMSKMLEERFGDLTANTLMKANAKAIAVGKGPNKSSSVTDISAGGGNREINMNQMLGSRYSLNKTFSLENISLYDMQPRSRHSFSASQTPDLVRIINQHQKQGRMNSSAASSVENIGQLYPTTSSSQCLSSIGGGSGGGRVVDEASFISEKLYNEFHVKTKLHSKSSTHLNRWPFQAKQNGMGQSHSQHQQHQRMKKTSSIVNITSDYGSVQDLLLQGQSHAVTSVAPSSVAVQPSRITILHKAHKDVTKEFINTNTDEYYAEICNGQNTHHHHHNHTSRTQIVNVL